MSFDAVYDIPCETNDGSGRVNHGAMIRVMSLKSVFDSSAFRFTYYSCIFIHESLLNSISDMHILAIKGHSSLDLEVDSLFTHLGIYKKTSNQFMQTPRSQMILCTTLLSPGSGPPSASIVRPRYVSCS